MEQKQIVVSGLGSFGAAVASRIYQMGHEVMAIDIDEAKVQKMVGEVSYQVTGDSTDPKVLQDLGIQEFDIGIVAIGANIEASIMTAVLFKSMKLKKVVARSHNELHGNTLKLIGCSKVVHPEADSGVRLAHRIFNPLVDDYLEITESYGISRINLPERLIGLRLKEVGFTGLRDKYGVSVVAIKRGSNSLLTPASDEKLEKSDTLFLSGPDTLIQQILDTEI